MTSWPGEERGAHRQGRVTETKGQEYFHKGGAALDVAERASNMRTTVSAER